MKKTLLALALTMLTGCAHAALDETYGLLYNTLFAAQLSDRSARETLYRGEEARRVMSAHYETLAPEGNGGNSANSPPTQQRQSAPPSQSPFRIGPH